MVFRRPLILQITYILWRIKNFLLYDNRHRRHRMLVLEDLQIHKDCIQTPSWIKLLQVRTVACFGALYTAMPGLRYLILSLAHSGRSGR